nr:ATP-binding cassette domain-containing protein [Vaccinium witches'-broom phytoplasma]
MSDILKIIDLQINFNTSQGMIYALRGVNFNLQKGEIFAICGESGSGKSITSKAIAGLLPSKAIVKKR